MILDGKKVSEELIQNFKKQIEKEKLNINFVIIMVGNDEASKIYVNNKIKKCNYVGINTRLIKYDEISEEELINLIKELNEDESVNGILIQSPIFGIKDEEKIFNMIKSEKDIDGFSCESFGKLVQKEKGFISCTPLGIIKLFEYYNIDVSGKDVVIINRSNIVGMPLSNLLIKMGATVTVCHTKTKDIKKYTKDADIVISAVGKPNFITGDMIKDGSIIVDVGISRVDGKVVGDVNFESVKDKTSYITPVPGGVGPMTISMVINNLIESVRK